MKNIESFILIPLIGYVGLWVLASPLFLLYFKLFKVAIDLKHTVKMIQKLPASLAIMTVPVCSFIAFFISTKGVLRALSGSANMTQVLQIGLVSLVCTIVLDMLITVVGEKIDIRKFPLNIMYLFAWFVIIPSVVLAGL